MKKLFFVFMLVFIGCVSNHPKKQSLKLFSKQETKNSQYQYDIKDEGYYGEDYEDVEVNSIEINLSDVNESKINELNSSIESNNTHSVEQNFIKVLSSLSQKEPLKKISKIYKVKSFHLLYINLGPVVHFDTDKYKIKNEYFPKLDKIFNELKECNCSILVIGHTDSRGSDRYNQALSELRAREVYKYMISQGIDKNRLDYIGYGEEQPLTTNSTPEGRAINRRVELLVSKDFNVSSYFLNNREINTSYWNDHNIKTAGKIEISEKGWTKNLQSSQIKDILIKLKKKKREPFNINKDKRILRIKLKRRVLYIKVK